MAKRKSARYPFKWSDGEYHSRPQTNRTVATSPLAGTYDPTLDIQQAQASRGLSDLLEDLGQQGRYADADFSLGQEALNRNRDRNEQQLGLNEQDLARDFGRSREDLGRQRRQTGEDYSSSLQDMERMYGRSFADLLKSRARGGEDYASAIEGLQRDYARQADSQRQQAGIRGVLGGAIAQAKRKRGENMALDQAPMDRNFSRFSEDSAQAESRLSEDQSRDRSGLDRSYARANEGFDTASSRLGEDYASGQNRLGVARTQLGEDFKTSLGDLMKDYQRGNTARSDQGVRAIRENTFYQQDVNTVKVDQARAYGGLPQATSPAAPRPVPPKTSTKQLYDWGDGRGRIHTKPKRR